MRIDNLTPPPVKAKSRARIAAGTGRQATEGQSGNGPTDRVSLSGLAQMAGGADAGRIEQLHGEVAAHSYSIPALDVSRRILEYALAG